MSQVEGRFEKELRLLSDALAKRGLSIQVVAELASKVVAVFLNDDSYGILFFTNVSRPIDEAIAASGGPERVMPPAWAQYKMGYLWSKCTRTPADFGRFRDNYAMGALRNADGSAVIWFPAPSPIAWDVILIQSASPPVANVPNYPAAEDNLAANAVVQELEGSALFEDLEHIKLPELEGNTPVDQQKPV